MRLRQDPGPQNALGPAKFLFPNNYDVYLHGTNKPSLFAKSDRFLSSGCVRLPDPLGFAELLLKDDPAWTRARIEQMVKDGRNRNVSLAMPLPVHLVYDTAWVDEARTVQFRADVYRRDEREALVAERRRGRIPEVAGRKVRADRSSGVRAEYGSRPRATWGAALRLAIRGRSAMEQGGGDRRLHSAARLTRRRAKKNVGIARGCRGGGNSHQQTILHLQFPVIQGKYREFSRFRVFQPRWITVTTCTHCPF
jgi:hypothetical protein